MAVRRTKGKGPKVDDLLGPLEAEIMQVVWIRGASLVSEITAVLNQRRTEHLAYKTVLTICRRLYEKGLLSYVKKSRAFQYEATMTEAEFVDSQATKAADAIFERFGDLAVSKFIERASADPHQLAALRQLLTDSD